MHLLSIELQMGKNKKASRKGYLERQKNRRSKSNDTSQLEDPCDTKRDADDTKHDVDNT